MNTGNKQLRQKTYFGYFKQ